MNSGIRTMEPLFTFHDDAHLKKQREKARKLRSTQWWKRKRSLGVCHYCGQDYLPKDLTMDHVIPIARGGRSEKFNLVPCCKDCNTKKKQMLPAEWDAYMKSIQE